MNLMMLVNLVILVILVNLVILVILMNLVILVSLVNLMNLVNLVNLADGPKRGSLDSGIHLLSEMFKGRMSRLLRRTDRNVNMELESARQDTHGQKSSFSRLGYGKKLF